MSKIQFTIIIPTHNSMSANRNLKRTLDSIASQSFKNWEIVVVDNYSTDETKEIANSYPLRFFQTKSSIAKANNFGLENAKGNHVLFLDSDQELPPRFLEECEELIQKNRAECIGYRQVFVDPDGSGASSYNRLHNFERFMGAEPSDGIYCYSRKIIANARFPEELYVMEDYYFRRKILSKRPRIGYVKSVVLHYREESSRWLITRAWKYGRAARKMNRTGILSGRVFEDYSPFTKRNQQIRVGTNVGLFPPLSYIPFMFLKYIAFALGFATG